MGTSGNILVSVEVLTEFKLVACLMVGLVEAVTLVLNLEAEVVEVIEISEKGSKTLVGVVYRPPNSSTVEFLAKMNEL